MPDNLSDEQKSVMLAKAMGWQVVEHNKRRCTIGHIGERIGVIDYPFNLYAPANFALAWKVLNWATEHEQNLRVIENGKSKPLAWVIYMTEFMLLPPADAQRLWLDKILELAIEAGLVEVDDVA